MERRRDEKDDLRALHVRVGGFVLSFKYVRVVFFWGCGGAEKKILRNLNNER